MGLEKILEIAEPLDGWRMDGKGDDDTFQKAGIPWAEVQGIKWAERLQGTDGEPECLGRVGRGC